MSTYTYTIYIIFRIASKTFLISININITTTVHKKPYSPFLGEVLDYPILFINIYKSNVRFNQSFSRNGSLHAHAFAHGRHYTAYTSVTTGILPAIIPKCKLQATLGWLWRNMWRSQCPDITPKPGQRCRLHIEGYFLILAVFRLPHAHCIYNYI